MAKRGRPRYPDILTPRESEVIALLREGLTNEQIAERLGVSRDGVKYHVSEILSKLGVATREEAAAWRSEEARPWWMGGLAFIFWPARHIPFGAAATTAGAVAVVATAGGIALLAWGLAITNREDDATGLAQVPTATASAESTRLSPSPAATVMGTAVAATPVVTPTPRETPQPTPTPAEEAATAAELIARAYEAMTRTSFAADVPPEPPAGAQLWQPPYSIKYGPPDQLLISGGGYEYPAYLFLVGRQAYVSSTGSRWQVQFPALNLERLSFDPREVLRVATDVTDEGTQDLDGEPHRVVTVRPDVTKFADEYLTDVYLEVMVDLPSTCPTCPAPCPECARPFDLQRVEALGYRSPDGHGDVLLKGRDISVNLFMSPPYGDQVFFTVQGVQELSPALKAEFREVLEAYGADPALLDAAEVSSSQDPREGYALELEWWAQSQLRLWINPKTFLVSKMEPPGPAANGTDELTFIDYGQVELPQPEPAIVYAEWEYFSNEVQRRWNTLAQALEAYAGTHGGLYPDELSPAALREALASEGLEWPLNAVTGEPMKETEDRNPGDFRYHVAPDRHCYFAQLYDWEGSPMDEYAFGPEGAIMCPEAGGPAETPTPSSAVTPRSTE